MVRHLQNLPDSGIMVVTSAVSPFDGDSEVASELLVCWQGNCLRRSKECSLIIGYRIDSMAKIIEFLN